ncbi:MAG: sigma-70 family RNA polymerase sigma factor [Planctomycetota bacterium]
MIAHNTSQSDRINPDQLWYVPDPRLRTKATANKAVGVAEWVTSKQPPGDEPGEEELFIAMHTCAYRAGKRSRKQRITAKERDNWIRRWQDIREYIVEKNLGLVYSMIGRFGSKKLDEDDVLSDAMFGLSRAVDRYNPWRGYRFSTYACNVISRAIMRRGKRENRYRELFPVEHEASFERPMDEPDTRTELYLERLGRIVDRNLGQLTYLESMVLSKRFPEEEHSKLTFQEIGSSIGLSKERVRQIQNVALRKLRSVLSEDTLLQ